MYYDGYMKRLLITAAIMTGSLVAQHIETSLGSPERDEVNPLYSQITISAKTSMAPTDAFLFTMWFKNGRVESKVIHVTGQPSVEKSASATFHWVTEKTLPLDYQVETISRMTGNSQILYSTLRKEAQIQ